MCSSDLELFLAPKASFDYERERAVNVLVRATDNGTPPLFIDRSIRIVVADVNEFAPELDPISFSVFESASGNTVIGRVVATDGDTANTVRYRFFGNPPLQFALNTNTGILSLKPGVSLDYETTPVYRFYVEAYDDGTPSLSSWVSAVVNVLDVNEFAPVITTEFLIASELAPVGVPFGRVAATDGDNETVLFSLPANEKRFSIDPETGDLSVAQAGVLDFERKIGRAHV